MSQTTCTWVLSKVTTEPPLGGSIISCSATEAVTANFVETKVVFTANRTRLCIEFAFGQGAVNVKKVYIFVLPHRNWSAIPSHVSTNIYVLHLKATTVTNEGHDIRFAKFGSDVISVINRCFEVLKSGSVEAAGCTPVCGEAAQSFHARQSLAVHVPVWCILVDRRILLKSFSTKVR